MHSLLICSGILRTSSHQWLIFHGLGLFSVLQLHSTFLGLSLPESGILFSSSTVICSYLIWSPPVMASIRRLGTVSSWWPCLLCWQHQDFHLLLSVQPGNATHYRVMQTCFLSVSLFLSKPHLDILFTSCK